MHAAVEDLIGPSEVSHILNCSRDTVRMLALRGELPAVNSALGRLFDRRDVARLADERARRQTEGALA